MTIVGAGPVGLFGAFYAGLRGMSVRVVDSLSEPGGQLTALYPEKPIYDMPGFPEVVASQLASDLYRQASRFAPEMLLGRRCETLSRREDHWMLCAGGEELPTKTLIICAGVGAFTPTKMGVEREDYFDGRGLTYGVRDKEALRGKRVAIVGGGDSALDWALGLETIASELSLIHRRDGFSAHEDSVRRLTASTVGLRLWEIVSELEGNERLTAVTTENKKTGEKMRYEIDALVVNIGYKTNLGPLKDWGLEIEKNKIIVDSRMHTNLDGVYAAGDICTHDAKLDLIATGVGEVCTAVNFAKVRIDPESKAFPGHSSDMTLPSLS
ncbi:MAG: NAD(P)/FAD-dependent oxidoreductase [Armatimonadota bacterium]|nr:NAD(P)/FAD-dependent oxidoreductase [Armatimonadota bacterium]